MRYLKKIMQMGLVFGRANGIGQLPQDLPLLRVRDYANSNFVRDLEDKKLVIGYCFFLNEAVVLWRSKKQRTVSTSITEAK